MSDTEVAKVIAHILVDMGVPVFVAKQARKRDGSWDFAGEEHQKSRNFVNGYLMPNGWQKTVPDHALVDAWEPGDALCATGNGPIQFVDVDSYHGADESVAGLRAAGAWPTTFGEATTPSGGKHYLVAGLKLRTSAGRLRGIDIRGGVDGNSVGFVFIAPTRKRAKDSATIGEYTWVVEPDIDAFEEYDAENDDGAIAFVDTLREHESIDPKPKADRSGGRDYDSFDESARRRIDAWVENTLSGLENELRAAHSWPEGYKEPSPTNPGIDRGWERLCADTFFRGAGIAAAQWNPLTYIDVGRRLMTAAPKWEGMQLKWAIKSQTAPALPLPFDPTHDRYDDDDDLTLTGDDGEAIVDAAQSNKSKAVEKVAVQIKFDNKYTDVILADEIIESDLRNKYAFTGGLGWIRFTGTHWQRCDESVVIRAVSRVLKRIHARDYAKAQHKHANDKKEFEKARDAMKPLLSVAKAINVLKVSKGELAVDDDKLDSHSHLLNCANGVVDLRTGKLMPHDASLYITKLTETRYVAGATHPDWEKALEAVPEDVREWLQIRWGQGITGVPTPDDAMLIQVGGGSNGKSTLMEAIMHALGEYAVLVPPKVLLGSPSDHPTELMVLRGARYAVMEETPEARHLNVTRLKMVLGSRISARLIRKDSVEFDPTHSLFVNTNYIPLVAETDTGTWRRLVLVNFPYTFRRKGEPLETENDRVGDTGLRERMKLGTDGQHEAVLAWLVEGARKWYAAGASEMPSTPDRVLEDTRAWRFGSDPMTDFIDNTLELGDGSSWVSSRDLFRAYIKFTEDLGYKPITERTFSQRFSTHYRIEKVNRERGDVIRKLRMTMSTPGRSLNPDVFERNHSEAVQAMAWEGVAFAPVVNTAARRFEDHSFQ